LATWISESEDMEEQILTSSEAATPAPQGLKPLMNGSALCRS
jgi:hypothetical protein